MDVVAASSLSAFEELEETWRSVAATATPSPLSGFEFVLHWYRCFAQPDEVRVYALVAEGKTVGFFPMVRRTRYTVRVLQPLFNSHCYHARPVVPTHLITLVGDLTRDALLKDRRNWDLLRHDFDYSFDGPQIFANDTHWRDMIADSIERNSYLIRLRENFSDYLYRDLSKKTRNAISRFKRKLERAGRCELIVKRGNDLINSWSVFVKIEDSGWKGRARSSICQSEQDIHLYYDGYIRLLADMDAGMIFFLELDGEPIAGAFGYREGPVFHCWKTGFLESHAEFAPSIVLMNLMLEHLAKAGEGLELVHLFPGNYGYKHRFSNEPATCRSGWVFNTTMRGRAVHAAREAKRRGLRMLRKGGGVGESVNGV